jgi:hypothetical protein
MMGSKVTIHIADKNGVSTGETEVIDTRDLAEAQGEALARIAVHYEAIIAAGVIVSVQGRSKIYQIDDAARINMAGAAADAAAVLQGTPGAIWPADFSWIAADNTEQPMSAADCFAWAQAIKSYWTAVAFANRALKNQVLALTSREECDALDVSRGWP